MDGWRSELRQFSILSRHFFGRLFRNDMVDFEDQMKEKLIVALSLLAVFFSWASWLLLFKYHFVADINRSWQEKNYIFTLMMLVFALITLLEWDILYPDRRDFLNLTPLPVRLRTMFAAKLASFVLFIGLFSAAMMSVSSVLFSMYLTDWRANSLVLAVRYVFSHLAAGFAAAFTVFFSVVFLQFLMMAVLPGALYRKSAMAARFVLAVGLIFVLLSFAVAPSSLGRSFHDLGSLKDAGDPFMFRFPALWFVGLYEVLLGTRDAVFEAEARTAGLALVLALVAFLGSGLLSYRRQFCCFSRVVSATHTTSCTSTGPWSTADCRSARPETPGTAMCSSSNLITSCKRRGTSSTSKRATPVAAPAAISTTSSSIT